MNFEQLAHMTGGTSHNLADLTTIFSGVAIDSRAVRARELFVAIRGEHNDGHQYVNQALSNGAVGVISQRDNPGLNQIPADIPLITVDDSHEALMLLAQKYRESLTTKYVGITGSNGKTTTKELTHQLACALDSKCYRSPGNLNNLYGLPLALFGMPDDTRFAIMEMGISRPGEMTRLAKILPPDVIIITNIGPSHLQYLGSVVGVARAKLELVAASDSSVPLIINGDDQLLLDETRKLRSEFLTFGMTKHSDYYPDTIEQAGHGLAVTIDGKRFNLPWNAQFQVYNLVAAFAACSTLGLNIDQIETGKIKFKTAPMRGEQVTIRGVEFIADCYNANPDSVKASLDTLAATPCKGRRGAILGDMLELGADSANYHYEIGSKVAEGAVDYCIAIGEQTHEIVNGAIANGMNTKQILHCANVADASVASSEYFKSGDLVLLKASRSVGLERLIDHWLADEDVA